MTPAEEIMEGMNEAVRTGKARYIGIANAYAYQVAKMNAMAEQHGWTKFISVQNHYNLIMREEEREMFPFCHEENIAMTPYSMMPLPSRTTASWSVWWIWPTATGWR